MLCKHEVAGSNPTTSTRFPIPQVSPAESFFYHTDSLSSYKITFCTMIKIILRYLRPIVLLAAAALHLSCESRQEFLDRMDSIVGEYRLAEARYGSSDLVSVIPENERAVATVARIYSQGDEWIFEGILPFPNQIFVTPLPSGSSSTAFSYHMLRKRLIWDQELGDYFFHRFTEEDLPESFDPTMVRLEIRDRTVHFYYKNISFSWIKNH